MRIRVSLNGDIAAPAEIDQMETLIQEAGWQAMKEALRQDKPLE